MAFSLVFTTLVSAFASGLLPLVCPKNTRTIKAIAFTLLGVSGLSGICAGGLALATKTSADFSLPVGLPWLQCRLHLDPLSGFFILIVSLVVLMTSIYGPAYVKEYEQGEQPLLPLTLFSGLFVAGMNMVMVAADAFSFMISWELMSVTSYFLVAYQHQHETNRNAAFIYLLMAQIGGLFILLGYGILAGFGGGFDFAAMSRAELTGIWSSVAFVLAFIGFGMKAGIVPLHVWLPQAHPVAPSHISALMSGVMLKVAVYGFVRFTYDLLGTIHWQWGAVVLFFGSLSAVSGVLYALMQHDLKRLLAYHSVENIGIIYMGLGLSMIFAGSGYATLGALALVAALYHCLNHALFKSLLFLGAGVILQQTRQHDLEHLGGLMRRLPVTATCFLIGCISISALPPFNGFVSEWLTFQAALQGTILSNRILAALIPVAAAVLALTGALAAACFVKVFGICFLGQARSAACTTAIETASGPKIAQALLALLCLLFGILPTWTIARLEGITEIFFPGGSSETTAHGWLWVTPISPETASYGAPMVLLGIGCAWLLVWLWLHPRRNRNPVRTGPAWDCGFGPLNPRMQYTATSFSMPIRRIFRPVWPIEEKYQKPGRTEVGGRYHLRVGDWAWLKIYQPIGKLLLATAQRLAMIQGGNIRAYLTYSFFTLIFLLLVVSL